MDDMRIGCFQRTGCLLTHDVNIEYDRRIQPQGVTQPLLIPTEPLDDDVTGNGEAESNEGNEHDLDHVERYLSDDENEEAAEIYADGGEGE